MQRIVPNLWFDTEALEAAQFYTSVFQSGKITDIMYYTEGSMRPAGMVLTVTFELEGQSFIAINGGPEFHFTEAISLMINCTDQAEIDRLWETLSEGGEKGPCGWLKDRYGLSWQVTPVLLEEMLRDPDPIKAQRVMVAMLGMGKLDIEELKKAYQG